VENYNIFIVARAIHVVSVVMWIGGVYFVTTVIIPKLRKEKDHKLRLEQFESVERKFALQAKYITVVAGLTGFYMVHYLNAWERFLHIQFWWLQLMSFVWLVFTVVLFLLEPLVLHRWFHKNAETNSDRTFALLHNFHKVILTISLVAVFGAVAGSHGLHL
jgi:uncharacterized membrane protein